MNFQVKYGNSILVCIFSNSNRIRNISLLFFKDIIVKNLIVHKNILEMFHFKLMKNEMYFVFSTILL